MGMTYVRVARHEPLLQRVRRCVIAALGIAAILACPTLASAGPCDLTWDGEKLAQGRNPANKTRLLDSNKNVVAELTGAQILAITEAKDGIAKQLGRSPKLLFCSDKAPNAFAMNTQNGEVVGVTIGLAKLMNGDRDMAAIVIGHEYAHLVLGHLAAAERRREFLTLLGEVAGVFLEVKTQTKTNVQGLGMNVGVMSASLISTKFDRDQERQADEAGFRYMVDAGFNPLGAIRLAEILQRSGAGGIGLFFDNHPGWPERTARFQALIKASPAAQAAIARTGAGTALASASTGGGQTQVSLVPVYEASDPEKTYAAGMAALNKHDFQAGVTAVRASADAGYAPAQSVLGYFYSEGRAGLPKEEVEAVRLYRLAVAQSNSYAMNNLGVMYKLGRGGLAVDQAEAIRLFTEAAKQGNPLALMNLGAAYFHGKGVAQDYKVARNYFEQAADAGNADALAALGTFYEHGWAGLEKNIPKAIALYRQAADKGSAQGRFCLGVWYNLGNGEMKKDEVEAVKWLQLAADQGNADAQNNLGVMYMRGAGGLPKSYLEAVRLYKLSADGGNPDAQSKMGSLYLHGEGGYPRDPTEAARLLQLSVAQGNAFAQANLGEMYFEGEGGLSKDPGEALRLYRLSAAQGNALGQYNLGAMYEFGHAGLPEDKKTAVSWYQKAAAQGHAGAVNALSELHVN